MTAVPPRHVLITGASSGLGAALARVYAKRRWMLSLLGRDAERLAGTARDCSGAADVSVLRCDLRDVTETERQLVVADERSPVDVLIANAAIGGSQVMVGPSGESRAQAHAIVQANLLGVINTVAPLAPRMVARGSGQIVLIGSIAGMVGLPHAPIYSATKAAVQVYGEGLRRRLAGAGVSVTVVCPGFVETPMSASLDTPRPFLWTAERAAAHIASAVDKRPRMLIFPWQLRWAIAAARLLPAALVDRVLAAQEIGAKP